MSTVYSRPLPASARLVLPLAAAALLTAADAQRNPLNGLVAGKPNTCVALSPTDVPVILDERTILLRQGGRVWRTGPVGSCPALRAGETLVTLVQGAQLCRNDRFRVMTPGLSIPSPFCRFDRFTPFDRPGGRRR